MNFLCICVLVFTRELLTGCNHYLILFRADPQEGKVVLGVDVSDCAACLHK